jgi:hypothetical protein
MPIHSQRSLQLQEQKGIVAQAFRQGSCFIAMPHENLWENFPLELIHTPKFLLKQVCIPISYPHTRLTLPQNDIWTEGASHMCNVHNTIFRGYNSIYQQAPHIRDGEKANFIGYCLTWYKFVHTHAMAEESGFFPVAEKLLDEEVFKETHKEHGNHTLASKLF